jgi:hypothetical protein
MGSLPQAFHASAKRGIDNVKKTLPGASGLAIIATISGFHGDND